MPLTTLPETAPHRTPDGVHDGDRGCAARRVGRNNIRLDIAILFFAMM
jgi:hypothetical protein